MTGDRQMKPRRTSRKGRGHDRKHIMAWNCIYASRNGSSMFIDDVTM